MALVYTYNLVFLGLVIWYSHHINNLIVPVVLANSPSSCLNHERLALLGFKQYFIIDCTTNYDSYPKVNSWTTDLSNGNCCLWDGVECDKETGHVTRLDLSNSCLYGTFPRNESSLVSLTHLEELQLSYNNFNFSHIPSQIGQFSNLKILNLSYSYFSGQIPQDISELSQLSILDLSSNGDTSDNSQLGLKLQNPSLEMLLRNLTRLHQLILDQVDISSPVPNILGDITSLRDISLRLCNLYGQFPTSVFHLPHLEKLELGGNEDLTGFLPEFRQNSRFIWLSVAFTGFHREVPPSIGNLANLEVLLLPSCGFTGAIPSSIGNLTKLTNLELAGNHFSGEVPDSIANLTQLEVLSLENLNVRPESLLQLNKLTRLQLRSMNLSGEILSFVKNMTNLVDIDLSGNQLTGEFPHWLMNLTRLEWLYLTDNQLEGPIPYWISQLANLESLWLSGNDNLYGDFDPFLKLKYLNDVDLSGVKLRFPSKTIANESSPKFISLHLDSCNFAEFPRFLYNQDQLELLSLKDNDINGLVPRWFMNATRESLYMLNLSNNSLTGFEQPIEVLPWSNLETLRLKQNKLQGALPIPLSSSIRVYEVSNNLLDGDIPQQICEASSLKYFDISNNNLGGQIPECISHLGASLFVLNLQGNNFHGTIPQVYPKYCKLKMINLSQNRLEGKMPRSLANCVRLEVLDFGNNHVNDTFPSWLGSLPNLQILVLRHNNFHGRIGKQNASVDFPSLRIIDLSHNFHTGGLPSNYLQTWNALAGEDRSVLPYSSLIILILHFKDGDHIDQASYTYSITITNKGNDMEYPKILTVFRAIDLSSNNITGSIPNSIGELRGLQSFNLSNNNLNGGIPSSLASLRYVESLDLSNNMLSGEIPQQLTQLTYLEVFNVSRNLLVGPIPEGQQFNTFDRSSFDGNLGLCGSPLSNKCGNTNSPTPSQPVGRTMNHETEEDSKLIDWIIKSCGCVAGLIVGFVIGKIYITDRHHHWFMDTFGVKKKSKRKAKRTPRQRS